MTAAGSRPIAPSSKLALYLGALLAVYLIPDRRLAMEFAVLAIVAALLIIARARRPVPPARWRVAAFFIAWVFIMRAALDLVAGSPIGASDVWLTAGQQAGRVGVLAIGVVALISVTTARDIVDELERSRWPRSLRLLVMMLVQYPRVLRDRYDQIVEAQVARGADRPRTLWQRVSDGAALLLPVMQSELNAVGDRAGLIHLRGLDVEVPAAAEPGRSVADLAAVAAAVGMIVVALWTR